MPKVNVLKIKKPNGKGFYWQTGYTDPKTGKRVRENHASAGAANSKRIEIEGELQKGIHIAGKNSVSLSYGAIAYLEDFEQAVKAGTRERSTLTQYKNHVHNHINPSDLGHISLAALRPSDVEAFIPHLQKKHLENKKLKRLSDTQIAKILTTLRSIIDFCIKKEWVMYNAAAKVYVRTATRGTKKRISVPPKAHMGSLLAAAEQTGLMEHAFAALLIFAGPRISELRGVTKASFDWNADEPILKIEQRADQWGEIGLPKTDPGRREIPLGPYTANAVRKWVLACPTHYLFTHEGIDAPAEYHALHRHIWEPLHVKAGLYVPAVREKRKIVTPPVGKVHGFHRMRHVAASLWIEQKRTPKEVQEMMGHARIQITMDIYGHLWPSEEKRAIVSAAEQSILATKLPQNAKTALISLPSQ